MKLRIIGALMVTVAAGAALGLSAQTAQRTPRRITRRSAGQDNPGPGGRRATSPLQIPLRGWKAVLTRTYGQLAEDSVMLIAAGVTFYALLALFPAITALVSIYGLAADPSAVVNQIEAMRGLLPQEVLELLAGQMERIVSQPRAQLSVGFAIGLGFALWSANNGMKAIFEAMNIAYNQRETRSFIRLTLTSLLFTLAAIFFVIVIITSIVVIPAVLAIIDPGDGLAGVFRLGRWPVLFLIGFAVIMVIYRYGPDRERAQWRWVLPGAALASFFWIIASIGFSWYVANFNSYNETYGSLGAVIVFMVWIWVSATIVIMGAELNAETERQTRYDSTTGPPQPIGQRGAYVADTIP